jgi:fosfomycin resistance protein FosX
VTGGLSHITLQCRDLDRMEELLVNIFDARKVYDSGEKTFSLSRERFYLIGPEEGAVWLAVMEGDAQLPRSYNHIAFKIDDSAYDAYLARITALGLDIKPPRPRVKGEGRSIYFHDHDNHLFELHTGTLEQRLVRYRSGKP